MTRLTSLTALSLAVVTILVPMLHVADGIPLLAVSSDPDKIHFLLFPDKTDVNATEELFYQNPATILSSRFRPGVKTVFIIHGFRSNVSSDMPQVVKNAFLNSGLDYNVIVVSWGALSLPTLPTAAAIAALYPNVTMNVPILAQRVADMVLFMQDIGVLKQDDVYMVGHSLGGHTVGLAAQNIYRATGRKLKRVTALDPAGPMFFQSSHVRNIERDDAQFVDVYHTNQGWNGYNKTCGHADFYPNGPGIHQPGCLEGDLLTPETLGRCSHWYAYRFFAASITQTFRSCPCNPIEFLYSKGLCPTKCLFPVNAGFHCPSTARGQYYFRTSQCTFTGCNLMEVY